MELLPLVVLLLHVLSIRTEVFTALATLTMSLEHERDLAVELRRYVEAEKQRLEKVLELAKSYEEHAGKAMVDAERFVANPINAYLFVKKFTVDLDQTKGLLSSEANTQAYLTEFKKRESDLPDNEDLEGIISALLRLQDTYSLSTRDIVEGTFTPVNQSPRLTVEDSYNIGKQAYFQKDYHHSLLWMNESLSLLDSESESRVSRGSILDHLSFTLYEQGNIRRAMDITREWLELEPNHERAIGNMAYFKHLEENGEIPDGTPPLSNERTTDWYRKSDEFLRYQALCRGENIVPNPDVHKLTCYYTTSGNNPLLLLAPVKAEVYYLNPLLILYHDVISDNEIAIIKTLATPRLNRATVSDPDTGKLVHAHYRVSRSAWLTDEFDETVATLSRRISAVTHLSMEKAEELQVVNYGIGGQYEPHYDYARDRETEQSTFSSEEGNRIATWIYYFSEPDAGGYTVFTAIGAKVPPKKGSAAFWYNLLPSGEGDPRTQHAGCPVLAGSKWVANKWIHERGQEFMRPCGLREENIDASSNTAYTSSG